MSANFNFYLNRQGAQGRQGEQGEAGYSPIISVDTNTAAEYKLRIQNETTSFVTPNLRGNAIEDTGGTYVRYNPVTQMFETGFIDQATSSAIGGVLITPVGGLEAGGTDVDVPTSAEVYDYVESKITSIGEGYVKEEDFADSMEQIASELDEKISFDNLASSLVEGSNITLDVNPENNTITINATGGDLSNYVTLDTVQTITNSKTFDGNGTIHFSNISNGVYFKDSSSTERIRIFTARHSSGADYSDLTMQSYSDMQFRVLSPSTTVRLTDIITANTLANSAIQPADLADYAKLNQSQFFTELQNFSGGISLPTGNSINFHSPTTGSSGIISSPSGNTLQIKANTININSGGSSPIVKNLFDMVQLSDLSIATTSSNWLNYDNSTGEFSANVDTVVTQNSNNLITSGAVYDNLETKADKSQIHALKSYSDNGELLTDAEGLANVKNYAHSTFDLSKFTIVGSPNITDDGIASGFSNSKYLAITFQPKNSTWEIEFFGSIQNDGGNILSKLTRNCYVLVYDKTSRALAVSISSNGSSWDIAQSVTSTNLITFNQNYYFKLGWDKTKYYVKLSTDGDTYTDYINVASTTPIFDTNNLLGIGIGRTLNGYMAGYIDLKQFSITVDGVEVFSGNKTGIDTYTINGNTITIPYTKSITGSKIAPASSRQDIATIATALGFANYYTLDEENGNFTLPRVELYGLMGDKTLRDSYYNGVTYWELFSNRRLEQGGTCVSGVEYTLPRPFADANYTLTIPYTSKTATSFIPSATGDFMAKGMGLL